MSKITKSQIATIISEEIERFKKIKSLEEKKHSILETLNQLEEGKVENWNEIEKLLEITTKDALFDMLWNYQSGDEQKSFLEHAKDELGLSDEDDEDEFEMSDEDEGDENGLGLDEEKMTKSQKEKKEDIVLALKGKMNDFKEKYGSKAKDVMYATATKKAMEKK